MGHLSTRKGSYCGLEDIVRVQSRSVAPSSKALFAPETKECVLDDSKMCLPQGEDESAMEVEVGWTGQDFIDALGTVLAGWVVKSAAVAKGKPTKTTRFHSIRAPNMSISAYINRIHHYFKCSDECFVIALVYIDKLAKTDPALTVCDLTVHRLVVAAVMLAAKFHDDIYYSNAYYAKVGGLSLQEMNGLETSILSTLKFNVCVGGQEYQLYHDLVVNTNTA